MEDDDRDGVGCFLKENRTLWVGGVPVFDEASARERVRQNFGAWGRISSVRPVKNKVRRLANFFCEERGAMYSYAVGLTLGGGICWRGEGQP